jgi:hypothetical protein
MTYKRTHLSALAGVGTLFLAAASAQAVTTLYWVGTGSPSGSWDNTTQNWDTANGSTDNSAWVSGYAAQFSNGGTATINANVSAAELVLGANTTLTGNGSDTLTVTGDNPAANGAGNTLTVNGAAVDFSNGFIGGAANLELDSGTITVGGSTAIAPTSNGWSLNVTGGTLNANTVTHGFRLGSNFFNGSTGEAATATQSGGTVEVGGLGLQIGSGSGSTASTTSYTDSYTLSNGTLALASLNFGAVANTIAEFNLSGGTVTVNTNTISFDQGSSVGTSYFNFETGNGMLVLKDSGLTPTPWDFSTLTGIANSSFLVNGAAATSSELTFAADPTSAGYTDISLVPASVPDPATFGLMAIGGLALLVRRRKAFRV